MCDLVGNTKPVPGWRNDTGRTCSSGCLNRCRHWCVGAGAVMTAFGQTDPHLANFFCVTAFGPKWCFHVLTAFGQNLCLVFWPCLATNLFLGVFFMFGEFQTVVGVQQHWGFQHFLGVFNIFLACSTFLWACSTFFGRVPSPPPSDRPKFRSCFSLSRHHFHSFSLVGGRRRGSTRQPKNSKRAHFKAPALQTPPKFHERTPKREEKERKLWREGKNTRNFGPPSLRSPTLWALPSPPIPTHTIWPNSVWPNSVEKIGQMRSVGLSAFYI